MTHVLMMCHDQHLDRRVLAQANSLIKIGHKVSLLALSYTDNDSEEYLPDGIHLFRVGLKKIVPDNKIYKRYASRSDFLKKIFFNKFHPDSILQLLLKCCFYLASFSNWFFYKTMLYLRYQNRFIGDPLPFRQAFFNAGLAFTPNIIQVHDLPALEAGVDLATKWEIPLVYDAHELYSEQRSFSYAQRRLCSKREKKLIPFSNLTFAVNDSIADEMASRYQITRPITLTNAIDPPENFNPNFSYNLLREKLNLSSSRKILLFQGGFSRFRNLENLIDAMKFVKNSSVDLVMMGFGDYGKILKNKATRLGLLDQRIYFLPAVPLSELLQHSASANVGIIPYPHVDLNSYYCTPNKLFEFIQAQLPILANDSPELRRFVQDEGFGIVRPMKSSRQIAAAIDEAFNKPINNWKKNLSERHAKFMWQVQSRVYLEAMQLLIDDVVLTNKSKFLIKEAS